MSNQIVQSLWIDEKIGSLQKMCYSSYIEKGHTVHVYTYNEDLKVPEHVLIKDANTIIPYQNVFKDFNNSYATYSDWFRIALLNKAGGWWIDSDTICLKFLDFEDDYAFATEISNENGDMALCNAFMKLPKNSEFGISLAAQIEKKISTTKPHDLVWTEIGAMLLPDQINIFDLGEFIVAPEVFCPINYFNFKRLIESDQITLPKEAFAVHLWNKMWDWAKIDPEQSFTQESFIEKLKFKYL